MYEVNWRVCEIWRSFRYYVDKGNRTCHFDLHLHFHSRMAPLYDVFPRTFGWPGTRYFVSQLALTANTLRNHLIFRPSMVLYGQIVSGKHGQQLGGKDYGVAKEQTADWRAWLGFCDVVGKWELVKTPLVYLYTVDIWSHYQLESVQDFVQQLCLTKKQPLFLGGKPFMWFSKSNNFRWFFRFGQSSGLKNLEIWCTDGTRWWWLCSRAFNLRFWFSVQGKLVTVIWLIWGCGKRLPRFLETPKIDLFQRSCFATHSGQPEDNVNNYS